METLPLLREGAQRLGFTLTERHLEQFQLYYETLVDWNSRINLTSITDYEGVQVRHYLDSLTVAATMLDLLGVGADERPDAPPPGFKLIDIGTGAGFPGVPLKILWPHIHVALSESVGKKTLFLKALVDALRLGKVDIITGRAEELGQDKRYRQRYDVATARAVASLPVLCEYCLPLLKVGGLMLAPKKGDIKDELEGAKLAARILGGGAPELHRFMLPGEEEARFVVAVKKVELTPAEYPRRVGVAKKEPLGGQS